ncbi:MAG: response regulator transcription factor [Xanthomonadales bacterium]|nr:response regulator transcription factor [Xanthomonadales bacterium]
MRILIIEDNQQVARQVGQALKGARYVVDTTFDGEQGWFLGDTEDYDAVILDLGLPRLDGLTLLQRWRRSGNQVPVLILTSRDTWREKVAGLRAGADDYLAKPFEFEEMLARVEALIRRSSGHASPVLSCGPVELDTVSARVTLDGAPVALTALEFRVLEYLMQKKGKVVSKAELTEHIYSQDFDRDSNVIEVLINHLRGKAHVFTYLEELASASRLSPDGRFALASEPGDRRFRDLRSGWHWEVRRGEETLARSTSLDGERLNLSQLENGADTRRYEVTGPAEQKLRVQTLRLRPAGASAPLTWRTRSKIP